MSRLLPPKRTNASFSVRLPAIGVRCHDPQRRGFRDHLHAVHEDHDHPQAPAHRRAVDSLPPSCVLLLSGSQMGAELHLSGKILWNASNSSDDGLAEPPPSPRSGRRWQRSEDPRSFYQSEGWQGGWFPSHLADQWTCRLLCFCVCMYECVCVVGVLSSVCGRPEEKDPLPDRRSSCWWRDVCFSSASRQTPSLLVTLPFFVSSSLLMFGLFSAPKTENQLICRQQTFLPF